MCHCLRVSCPSSWWWIVVAAGAGVTPFPHPSPEPELQHTSCIPEQFLHPTAYPASQSTAVTSALYLSLLLGEKLGSVNNFSDNNNIKPNLGYILLFFKLRGFFCSKMHGKNQGTIQHWALSQTGEMTSTMVELNKTPTGKLEKQKIWRWLWTFQPTSFIIVPPLVEMCCSVTELIHYQGTLSKLLQFGFCPFCKCNKAYRVSKLASNALWPLNIVLLAHSTLCCMAESRPWLSMF